jgi:hypothetical protein
VYIISMFHWICPECGREIPPAVKECPACDPTSAVQASSIAPEPAPFEAAPEPNPLPDPLLGLAQKLREAQRDLELAAATAAARTNFTSPEPSPEPPSQPEPVALGPTALVLHPPMLLLASAPAAIALLTPPQPELAPELEPQWKPELEWKPEPRQEPAGPSAAGRVPTPDLAPLASPPPPVPPPVPQPVPTPPASTAVPAAPSGATFSQPALIAASSPAPPMLALAPLQDSSTIAKRIRLAAPPTQILRPDAGPRITLPGPALPPALNSLQDAGLSRILVDHPKLAQRSSGWLVGVAAAAVLLAGFLALQLYNAPGTAAEPKPAPPPEVLAPTESKPEPKPEPAAAVSPAASYSLSKAIEVTGFRFVGDKKPEVRYLVVNHSAAELGAVTVYVTLRSSAAKPGQPPLYRFSFRAPALGPFESKEMATSLDKQMDKPHSAADWQSLHADIELGQ